MVIHKLDQIEDSDNLNAPDTLLTAGYPSDYINDYPQFNANQIDHLAKMVIKALQYRVLKADLFDVSKFVFNFYGKEKFINTDFIDLVGSVLDYLCVNHQLSGSSHSLSPDSLLTAIESTIDAACVIATKRYPMITTVLSDNAKRHVDSMVRKTINKVNSYDSNSVTTGSTAMNMFNNMMNPMMGMMNPMMGMQNMFGNNGDNDENPMMKMMQQIQINQMMQNMFNSNGDNDENPMMKMMQQMQMNQLMLNMFNNNGDNSNPMMGMMNPMMGMQNMFGNNGDNDENPMMKMMQQIQINQMMQNMFNSNGSQSAPMMGMVNPMMGMNNMFGNTNTGNQHLKVNPDMEEIYNDPELNSPHGYNSHESQMLNEMNNNKTMQQMAEAYQKMSQDMLARQNNSDDDEMDVSVDCTGEGDPWWLEDAVDEGVVHYDDELANGIFSVFNTHEPDPYYQETDPTHHADQLMIDEEMAIKAAIERDKKAILDRWFGGVKPAGLIEKEYDGISYYAFTPEALYSGSYKATDTIDYYFNIGLVPPASAASLPLTIKGKTEVFSILFIDGQRHDMIIPVGDNMDIDEHIPPAAIIAWNKLKEKVIYDENGKALNDNNVFIVDDEFVGTANSVSITANAYALVTDEIELGNPTQRPIEYVVNDPVGFHCENVNVLIDLFGEEANVDNIKQFVKSVNESDALDIGVKSYIDHKGTAVINDFLLYSMGINVRIDSILTEYDDLEMVLQNHFGPHYLDYLRKAEKQLSQSVCNAVHGQDIDFISNISGEYEVVETIKGKTVKRKVEFDTDTANGSLVIFNNRTQVTELPWVYEDLGISLVRQHKDADPFVLLTKNEHNEDQYGALKEVLNRSMNDGVIKETQIITKDRIVLSILQSAYDENSFIIVGRGY